jgi:hypothetical protein
MRYVYQRTQRVVAHADRPAGATARRGISFALLMTVASRFPRRALLVCLALAAPSRALLAHTGRAPEPHDLWSSWTFAPAVIVGLALGAWW